MVKLFYCRKLFLTILALSSSYLLLAQHYFVRTDLVGYTYHIGMEQEIKSAIKLKYSLGFERMFDSSAFSVGMLLNYGTLPDWVYETSSPLLINGFVQGSTGLLAIPEVRYYFRKNKLKYFKGVFLGTYLMYFNGEHNYHIVFPSQSVYSDAEVLLIKSKKFQMLSLGICMGYKVVLGKKIFIEPLIGFGRGFMFPDISDIGITIFNVANSSARVELGIGYCF